MFIGKDVSDISVKVPEDSYDTGKHMPTFSAYLTAIVKDSTGRIVQVHRQRSHSPTSNFIGLLLPLSYFSNGSISYTITNATGGTYTYSPALSGTTPGISYSNNSYSYSTYFVGIQVGSGQQSSPFKAYSLAAPIANGSGAGQLVYGSPLLPANVAASGSSAYFIISQEYNNRSGSTVNVTETGIILYLEFTTPGNSNVTTVSNTLVWYDVLSSTVSVPNGGTVTIYYTFTVNP